MSLDLLGDTHISHDDKITLIDATLYNTIQKLREVDDPWAKDAQYELEEIVNSLHRYSEDQIDALCRVRFGLDKPSVEELGQARDMMAAWIETVQRILQGDQNPELVRHACSLSFWLSAGQFRDRRENAIKIKDEYFI